MTNPVSDLTYKIGGAGASSLADGDYGDILVAGGGTLMTLDADVVTNTQAANMPALTLKGNATGALADPQDLSAATVWASILGTVPNANFSGTYDAFSYRLSPLSTTWYQTGAAPSNSGRVTGPLGHFRQGVASTGAVVFTAPVIPASFFAAKVRVTGWESSGGVTINFIDFEASVSVPGGAPAAMARLQVAHGGNIRPPVRWAYDPSGKLCLIIGLTSTSWTTTLHLSMASALFGGSGVTDAACVGWTASQLTDLTGYTSDGTTPLNTTTDDLTANKAVGYSLIATRLETGRTFSLSGSVTAAGVSFDGTANVTLATSIAANAVGSAQIAANAVNATHIANNEVGNTELTDMATGRIKGRITAGTGDPEDLDGTQVTSMLNAFTSGLKGLAPASGGGTTNFLRADGTWAAPPGGGGGGSGDVVGPASSDDNAIARFDLATGKLIQNSGVLLQDDGTFRIPVVTSEPASVAEDFALLTALKVSNGAERLGMKVAGMDNAPLEMSMARWKKAYWKAATSATMGAVGIVATVTGTSQARNPATTSLFTEKRRVGYVSAATAGSSSGVRSNVLQFLRGGAAGRGGFYFCSEFGLSDAAAVADARFFVGLTNATTVIGNVNPSTLLNILGVGCENGQTTMRLYSNDGTGAATAVDLGANFPVNTNNTDWYRLEMWCVPNGSQIDYAVTRLNTGNVSAGFWNTNIPSNTTLLAPQVWRNNGVTALAVGIDIEQVLLETPN